MKQLIVITAVSLVLCAASLVALKLMRDSRAAVEASLQQCTAQSSGASTELQAAKNDLAEARSLIESTQKKLDEAQAELATAQRVQQQLLDRQRRHTARCDLPGLARAVARVKGLSEKNVARYKIEDLLGVLAAGALRRDEATGAWLREGECYLPPGSIVMINDLALDQAQAIQKSLGASAELTVQVEAPAPEAAAVEPVAAPASAPATP